MGRHCHIQLPFMCNCNNPICPKQSIVNVLNIHYYRYNSHISVKYFQ